jgi:hypothetical protein
MSRQFTSSRLDRALKHFLSLYESSLKSTRVTRPTSAFCLQGQGETACGAGSPDVSNSQKPNSFSPVNLSGVYPLSHLCSLVWADFAWVEGRLLCSRHGTINSGT